MPALSPAERLAAVAAKYAAAKTYRDSGRCTSEFTAYNSPLKDTKPFTTSFERGGRFRFQFRHSKAPGMAPTELLTVWSADQKAFDWAWTIRKQAKAGETLQAALVRATNVSGGATRPTLPLLMADTGLTPLTQLENPAQVGTEVLAGEECVQIRGTQAGGQTITLSIDRSNIIRKVAIELLVDPAAGPAKPDGTKSDVPPYTVSTNIYIDRPRFDLVIPNWALEAPEPMTP